MQRPFRSRHSQVTHYYFEGCEYYTPMVSRFGCLYCLYPFWVPENGIVFFQTEYAFLVHQILKQNTALAWESVRGDF
ncbi:MAG: hypothetical protein OXD01_07055 [Gammaproteobacteria bacterium]|nr:hypothetical protein [Gammaproteobacteria bacterium]